MKTLSQIQKLISGLDISDQVKLELYLSESINQQVEDLSELPDGTTQCPHCNSDKVILWCNYKKNKRFKCKGCNRTFTMTTGSVLHNLKNKEKFVRFSSLMLSGDFFDD